MTQTDPLRVVVERILPAPPAEVFAAWTDRETLRAFMCPGNIVTTDVEVDVRVGGRFRIVMRDGDRDVEHRGEYRVVDPPRRLAFTWQSPVTGPGPTLVTIDLAPHEDGTRLVLVHEQLPNEDSATRHRRGWTGIVEKLASHLAGRDLRFTMEFPVPSDRLYAQLATATGIKHWWTEFCEMDERVGGRASFRFPKNGFYAIVRIAALDPGRRVEWEVVESQHPKTTGFVDLNDWVGTRISFVIEPVDPTHSRLHFAHHGLVLLECSTICTSGWSFFLGQSLRAYLETGTGEPTKE
jgi:uncharacterized protein YndB with AHSA1/START domain